MRVHAARIRIEVRLHIEINAQRSSGDQGLHHNLFVTGSIVATDVFVIADVRATARCISRARDILLHLGILKY